MGQLDAVAKQSGERKGKLRRELKKICPHKKVVARLNHIWGKDKPKDRGFKKAGGVRGVSMKSVSTALVGKKN